MQRLSPTQFNMNSEQAVEEITPPVAAKQLAPRKIQVTRLSSEMAIEGPVWARLTPYLQEALRHCHGELSESSIKALVAADRQQIWVALAGEGAELLGVIEVPENVGNLNWGGDDWSDLYMPSTTSLYRISLKVSGNRLSYMT